jgi:CheY-like chemotaxis protein
MKNTILVVDDEDLVLYSVQRILQLAGFDVQVAKNGGECLSILRTGFKGLILMDIVMPGMDGWDTVKAIVDEGLFEGNIICMLTGKEIPDVKMDYLKEYVLDYILKPFESAKLVQICREYLSYLDKPENRDDPERVPNAERDP